MKSSFNRALGFLLLLAVASPSFADITRHRFARNGAFGGGNVTVTFSGGNITAGRDVVAICHNVPVAAPGTSGTMTGATRVAGGGTSLGSPYDVDSYGNTRGADGTWDRGALKYVEVQQWP